jgi:membrane-bound ClpP family serine protease
MMSGQVRADITRRDHDLHLGWAWVALCLALALHVTDEALTDFLSVYNPTVMTIRQRLPFLPLPTFTFNVWLTGLILAIILLLALSPFAFRGARWIGAAAYIFGIIMLANGLQHMVGSILMGKLMPGVYSSPLLVICSIYLLLKARHLKRVAESHV